jgi:hypothetical protein
VLTLQSTNVTIYLSSLPNLTIKMFHFAHTARLWVSYNFYSKQY